MKFGHFIVLSLENSDYIKYEDFLDKCFSKSFRFKLLTKKMHVNYQLYSADFYITGFIPTCCDVWEI